MKWKISNKPKIHLGVQNFLEINSLSQELSIKTYSTGPNNSTLVKQFQILSLFTVLGTQSTHTTHSTQYRHDPAMWETSPPFPSFLPPSLPNYRFFFISGQKMPPRTQKLSLQSQFVVERQKYPLISLLSNTCPSPTYSVNPKSTWGSKILHRPAPDHLGEVG